MVERTTMSRRSERNQLALPYARPPPRASQDKKSPLSSILNGIISWFKATSELDEDEPMEEQEAASSNPAAQALVNRGHAITIGQNALPPPPRRNDATQPPPLSSQSSYPQLPGGPPPVQAQPSTSTCSFPSAPPPGTHTSTSPSPVVEPSSRNNIETIKTYLNNKLGQGQILDTVEIAGVMALLEKEPASEPDEEKREPFRFSTSPSTRGNSPSMAANASTPSNGEPKKPRMLTKNPNGVYRWQGAGSARPRNRYQSPGFGPSRSQPTIRIAPEKTAPTDAKRRRVGEEEQTSTSQHPTAPAPVANGAASMSAAPNGTGRPSTETFPTAQKPAPPQPTASSSKNTLAPSAAPRLRTTGITKPTAPAVPSPLRNSWSNDPSSTPTTPRPTRAAALVTEILKEVTPSEKKKALINPYEALYPGNLKQLPKKKKTLKRKSSSKETAAAAAKSEQIPEEKKRREVELSPVKIIEATVPKGAKRARPPPEFEKQKPLASTQQPRKAEPLKYGERQTISNGLSFPAQNKAPPKPTVEEVPDEEQPSPPKKAKTKATSSPASLVPTFAAPPAPAPASVPVPAPVKPPVPARSISIEEVEDQDMESEPVVKPAQVIEPEENKRRSSSPTSPASSAPGLLGPKSAFGVKSSAPKAPSKLRFSIQPEKDEQMQDDSEPKEQPSAKPPSPVAAAPAPLSVPQPTTKAPTNVAEVKASVKSLPKSELKAYSFDIPASSPGAGPSTIKARDAAKSTPVSELPKYSFDFTAAPVSVPTTTSSFNWGAAGAKKPSECGDQWTCDTCMLKNPATATEKCTICDAPRPGGAPKAAPKAFDWSAAGMKAQPAAATGSWTCAQCMLQNPETAKEKCTICDAPRPGAKAAAPLAAGVKAQSASSAGNWTCGTCMLQNPDSAKEKCTICDAPRPGAKAAAPAAKGFDWAAAGVKTQSASPAGNWTCGTCMLQNPDSAKEKCTICDAPRPGAKPAAPATKGFDWAAAGMKPAATSGWTCKSCMLQNPADATKCTICDEPR